MRAFLIVCLLSLVKLNLAYIITVDSHAEECFFDSAGAGAKLGEFFCGFRDENKWERDVLQV
jgi:hypothetical protein